MNRENPNSKVIHLFVPPELIQECLKDVQRELFGSFRSWVQDCHYIKETQLYGVLVGMGNSYLYVEEQWEKKWNRKYE